jgi:uncharacterized protein
MHYVWLGFIGGILAFAHCLGMCGGFALHLSQGQTRMGMLGRQLLWHAGKTATYVFLGALAGFLGNRITALGNLPWLQNALTYLVGGVMILMALTLLGLIPSRLKSRSGRAEEGFFSSLFGQFFRQTTPTAAFVLGLGTGFLPCPIVVGFLALSMHSGSVPIGMFTMGAMGIGTIWALLLLGLTGHLVTFRRRRGSPMAAGIVLLLLGTATIARGTGAFHRILGCPHAIPTAPSPPYSRAHSTQRISVPQEKTPCCCEPAVVYEKN